MFETKIFRVLPLDDFRRLYCVISTEDGIQTTYIGIGMSRYLFYLPLYIFLITNSLVKFSCGHWIRTTSQGYEPRMLPLQHLRDIDLQSCKNWSQTRYLRLIEGRCSFSFYSFANCYKQGHYSIISELLFLISCCTKKNSS